MSDFLSKLNLLVRSSMNNALSDPRTRGGYDRPPTPEELDAEIAGMSAGGATQPARVPVERLGKDIDKEIAALRKHIDQALADEDKMADRIDQVQAQVEGYDRQADEALQRGDEAQARLMVQQMQRQQALADQLKTGLRQHKAATAELIQRVSTLEAMVSDARRQAQEQGQESASPASAETSGTPAAPGLNLSSMLRDAREKVEAAITAAVPQTPAVDVQTAPAQEQKPAEGGVNVPITVVKDKDPKLEEDLARRRARLAKPE